MPLGATYTSAGAVGVVHRYASVASEPTANPVACPSPATTGECVPFRSSLWISMFPSIWNETARSPPGVQAKSAGV